MNSSRDAFARVELVALLAAVMLLLTVSVPLLGKTDSQSGRAVCYNNFRQIGGAYARWGADHNENMPWFTWQSEGGTRPDVGVKSALAWFEFVALSNELRTARVLACPMDDTAKVADDFGTGSRGFLNSGHRNNALSYSVMFDSNLPRPRAVLSTEWDFRFSFAYSACSQRVDGVQSFSGLNDPITWTNRVHSGFGHLLFADGSVEAATSSQLKINMVTGDDNQSVHYIGPR